MHQEIRIIEYEPGYAKALSDMWSRSADGWNGANVMQSTESVLREHENCTHLNTYLALVGEDVVGYCSLERFLRDEGALYIRLLNVRPDYHGKRVGKALVLQCVQRTIELNYPRLDLYTWPGNTKAVPLYKKCGFFWEKRDDSTHLMNFIPTVLATEAAKDFFADDDWYLSSTRCIEVKPDGRRENDFDFLEYTWHKEGHNLRIEFERTGRGICCLETDDYLLRVSAPEHGLVFGAFYQVKYEIVNKSKRPLDIELKGVNNKNISFALDERFSVTDQIWIEGEFYVGPIEEKQDSWKTHPLIETDALINGKEVSLKLGIEPKYPGLLSLTIPGGLSYLGAHSFCYINIESNLKDDAIFKFELPSSPDVEWDQREIHVKVAGKAKVSLQVGYTLSNYTTFYQPVPMEATLDTGAKIECSTKVGICFRGYGTGLEPQGDHSRSIINGAYEVRLNLKQNNLRLERIGAPFYICWYFPKLGKPFSDEFSKKEPDKVETGREGEFMVLKAYYSSCAYPGLHLVSVSQLRADGLFRHMYEVENRSDQITKDAVSLSNTFYFDMDNGVIPYRGKYIKLDESVDENVTSWNSEDIHENWLFNSNKHGFTVGLTWDESDRIKFAGYDMCFEYSFGSLLPDERRQTKPISVCLNLFSDWQAFRGYVQKADVDHRLTQTDNVLDIINGGNPFVNQEYCLKTINYKVRGGESQLRINSARQAFEPQDITIGADIKLPAPTKAYDDTLALVVDDGSLEYQRKRTLFCLGSTPVEIGSFVEKDQLVHYADNGVVRLKVAAEFAPTLYSLQTKDGEWLDSSFPIPGMKAWWNPWAGGFETELNGIPMEVALKEQRHAEACQLTDNFGNAWQGIVTTLTIAENEKRKGATLRYYYLLLPGSSVVCHVVEVHQKTGYYMDRVPINHVFFLAGSQDLAKTWIVLNGNNCGMMKLKAGQEDRHISTKDGIMCGSDDREQKVLIYGGLDSSSTYASVSKHFVRVNVGKSISVADGHRIFTAPVFLVISDGYMMAKQLENLSQIQFK